MITLLSEIIDTKTESALLAFLLLAPPRTFSVKELAVRLEQSPQAIGKAIHALEQQDIISSVTKGHVELYYLNPRNTLMPQIRAGLLKEHKLWDDELFSSLKKLGQLTGIFLSGMFTAQPQLPVDLLLVGKVNSVKLDAFLEAISKLMGIDINYSIMSEGEFTLRKDTFDRFLKDIFDYRHVVVIDEVGKRNKSKTKKKK